MVKTYAVLSGRYKGKEAPKRHTHALNMRTGATLCGKLTADSLTESDDEDAPASCPACKRRDPRSKTGGPFILSSLLQF